MAPTDSPTTITLFRGFPETNCYVWSPFINKLEARLRFGGLPYRTEPGSITQSPRGKLPYISISNEDGTSKLLSDSALITKELIATGQLKDLNENLSGAQKLQDISIQALLEDKLYFYQTHERWIQNFYTMRDKILAFLPWPVKVVVGNMVYKKNLRTIEGQGTGKFNAEEIADFRTDIWDTLNAALAESHAKSRNDSPFWVLGGEEPTEADAVVFGFISAGLVCGSAPITRNILHGHPAIMAYAHRIHDVYFPDYELWEEK